MQLTKLNKAVLATVSVTGLTITTSAMLAKHMEVDEEKCQLKDGEEWTFDFEKVSLPKSKEEAAQQWAEGYVSVRGSKVLQKFLEIVGQALVAPIAMVACDTLYNMYTEGCGSKTQLSAEIK